MRPARLAIAIVALAICATSVHAEDASPDDEVLVSTFDPATCITKPNPAAVAGAPTPIPVTWKEFEIAGSFLEPRDNVRVVIAPIMNRNRALTPASREDIRRSIATFGYHVVGIGLRDTPAGTIAVVHLNPLPMVRRVVVSIDQSIRGALLDSDEIKRRMRTRTAAYLPWSPKDRACELYEETRRIQDYLHDEGYFEARASIQEQISGVAVTLKVRVRIGKGYTVALDKIQIPDANLLAIDANLIREQFKHRGNCLLGRFLCFGSPRFTRAGHQADVQRVIDLFHKSGFPSVRVTSDFDPGMSIDRRTNTVRFKLEIVQGRQVEVVFEGHNPNQVSNESLRKQLTFDEAASADDVEAHNSARALAQYLQSRGYFDARVTWIRERLGDEIDPEQGFDRLVYRIETGRSRPIREVEFRGNRALSRDELAETVGTRPARLSTSLFGSNTAATSALLASDVEELVDLYRRNGYRDARIRVTAATDPIALDSAALTAAMAVGDRGEGLYVRFSIDEGQPTLLTQVMVELSADTGDTVTTPEDRLLCLAVLGDLADLYKQPSLAKQSQPDRCVGVATDLAFREDDAALTRDQIKDRLFAMGRPRSEVGYEATVLGPRRIAAKYRLANTQELRLGKVVIRGNFRTRSSVIEDELQFRQGAPLTKDRIADGARRLRNTALFDAVNITMPELETTSTGEVNAVVEVTERYDYLMEVIGETGYSSFNGAFVKIIPALRNLFGLGISLELSGTIGFDVGAAIDREVQLRQLGAEATLRFPQWLSRRFSPVEFQTEISAFHDRRETPRFGLLTTTGTTVALSRTWERQRSGTQPARAITTGIHWDFRSRERNVDALRPIGADDDESQVPITTRTGLIGLTFEWEQRVDRRGTLSPLSPESGFRFDGQIAYASPYLLGQDEFIKVSAAGSKYWSVGEHLIVRGDLRYDEGFPLRGAALLPEVERFFAGGDATVRGYNDDRLATEVIQVGVPPLGNVQQIRILPAGGNIRVLGSLDAQLRIYRVLATALFIDAGMISNQWLSVEGDDIRPSVGMALFRIVTPFGAFAWERAIPLNPKLGDDPLGRWHISFAARAQF
ncbi:MAG: POTRA domain-containing protein [Kofleriaceae bacterium]